MPIPYPETAAERDRWILARRPEVLARAELDPRRPYAFEVEDERSASGEVVPVATLFLTSRECPWRCLMCDLWRNTLPGPTPVGAIPAQIDHALSQLAPARQIKLYNSGSFFDRKAVPPADYPAIVARLHGFERVIVECHPSLVGDGCLRFAGLLREQTGADLEVAMGLETVHPTLGPRLNKRATPEQFAQASERLQRHGIALRAFILVKPPFMDEDEALFWAERSLDFAFDCQATVAALIPTRFGNGALESLAESGDFAPPRLATLEAAADYGVRLGRGRVFADLWDLEQFASCRDCFPAREARLRALNLQQQVLASVRCSTCGAGNG